MLALLISSVCLFWYVGCGLFCTLGYCQISQRARGVSESLPDDDVPHVTIIRPIKGLEPDLYECLAATFKQTYPQSKLTIYLCLASRADPASEIGAQVLKDHPESEARIFYEDEDPLLRSNPTALGPNPKIRNMSRAYREAKGDLIWIIDCNVWVAKGVAGRMVDLLCGFSQTGSRRYKFVHQLPLVVDVTDEQDGLLGRHDNKADEANAVTTSTSAARTISPYTFSTMSPVQRIFQRGGGRLEELFLSSAHAKWYTAINTILLAPCIVGKSNMFRRSHLAELTSASHSSNVDSHTTAKPVGIDFFSQNICEDHLIGDLLWKGSPSPSPSPSFGNHALLPGDPAIQPMAGLTISEYIARRVRWLRVRKFTVTLATLVEPGTESGFCSCVGAWAVTSPSLPFFNDNGIIAIPQTWTAFALFWLCSVTVWAVVDATLYRILHSMASVEIDEDAPAFVRRRNVKRSLGEWALAWIGREVLTLPIWVWAVWGGVTVVWRGQRFRVGMDMRVRKVAESGMTGKDESGGGTANGSAAGLGSGKKGGKARLE